MTVAAREKRFVSAVVLAAGSSTRFAGETPKQLTAIDGTSMVRRVAQAALASKASEVDRGHRLPAGARGRRGQGPGRPHRLQPPFPAGALHLGQDRPVGGVRPLVGGPLHSLRSTAPRHREPRPAGRGLPARARLGAGALPIAAVAALPCCSIASSSPSWPRSRATRAAARSCCATPPKWSRSSSRTRRRSTTSTPSKSSKRW